MCAAREGEGRGRRTKFGIWPRVVDSRNKRTWRRDERTGGGGGPEPESEKAPTSTHEKKGTSGVLCTKMFPSFTTSGKFPVIQFSHIYHSFVRLFLQSYFPTVLGIKSSSKMETILCSEHQASLLFVPLHDDLLGIYTERKRRAQWRDEGGREGEDTRQLNH